jgi:hypothetical protein
MQTLNGILVGRGLDANQRGGQYRSVTPMTRNSRQLAFVLVAGSAQKSDPYRESAPAAHSRALLFSSPAIWVEISGTDLKSILPWISKQP